ncbi:Response regulator receiver domain-containing protein [Bryocella elongata]|uniref:Response regulator receiver domain-containing protein n=1 Tax=Bryocella elongata TaxID=863522 RepID=A0A1H5S0G5_9BACT|nr:response regulator [Bryocella elongata]SEF43980.1 Response regulator receiver domain-containing protein [Bryocella elongata]
MTLVAERKLMIVDDESSIRTTLSQIFTERGYMVRSASDGFAALALIEDSAPDILLSDLNMPGMSGFELLSVVRRIHPAIYVVATSGAFSGKTVPDGIAADAFYEKATSLGFLFEALKQGVESDGKAARASNLPTTQWMIPSGRLPSNSFYVLMGCPRCLRAFPKVLAETTPVACRTECRYCGATISYAIAPMPGPTSGANLDLHFSHGAIDIDGDSLRFDLPSGDHSKSN